MMNEKGSTSSKQMQVEPFFRESRKEKDTHETV